MKKLLSILMAIVMCASLFAVQAAADEIVPTELVLLNWDGDLEVTATKGNDGNYSGMYINTKTVENGGLSFVELPLTAVGFKYKADGLYTLTGDVNYNNYLTMDSTSGNKHLVNNWYLLRATPNEAFNLKSQMTYPKLDYSFSFYPKGSVNGERRFTYKLGTAGGEADFLNLQVSFWSNQPRVTVTANGTKICDGKAFEAYDNTKWNDFKIVGTFEEGKNASFAITLNDVAVETVTSAKAYTKKSDLFVTELGLQNGSSTVSSGKLSTVRNTYYDNINLSTYQVPRTPVDVVFDLDGGSFTTEKTQWYEGDSIPVPVLPGYEFNGWKHDGEDAHAITTKGLYTAYWQYVGGAPIKRVIQHWENDLTARDVSGSTPSSVFGKGGSYASTEGNTVAYEENKGTVIHAPQVNLNYYNGVTGYIREDVSVLRLDYQIQIPNDEYKDEQRKTTFSLSTFVPSDDPEASTSDNYKDIIPLNIFFKDGKVYTPAQEDESNLHIAYQDEADVKYGEWMDVTVFAHIVDGGKTDYEVVVDGKTILKAVDENKDRAFSTLCIRTIRFDQSANEGVAYFDTYVKNLKLSAENRPTEIIRTANSLKVKVGATGSNDGMIYLAIFNKENRLAKAFLGGTKDETTGIYTLEITNADDLTACYGGSNTAKAFFWSADGNITPVSSYIGERVYLYK